LQDTPEMLDALWFLVFHLYRIRDALVELQGIKGVEGLDESCRYGLHTFFLFYVIDFILFVIYNVQFE